MSGNSNNMPPNWDVMQAANGRLYFVNHTERTTSWDDPRPLPTGWEKKRTERGRVYYLNHNDRSTSWKDPRKPIVIDPDVPQGTLSNSQKASERIQKDKNGHVRGHSLDKEWYGDVFRMSMVDRTLTTDEVQLLATIRNKLNITDEEHKEIVRETGWSENDVEEAKQDSERVSECVVCMEAPATHIVLDCMHLCLCGACSMKYNGIYKEHGCPNCRGVIRKIAKTY